MSQIYDPWVEERDYYESSLIRYESGFRLKVWPDGDVNPKWRWLIERDLGGMWVKATAYSSGVRATQEAAMQEADEVLASIA